MITIQAEASVGIDFVNGFFAGVSGNLPYATMGTDRLFSSDLPSKYQPYFILHTKTDYERKTTTTTSLSCEAGYILNTTTNECDFISGS